MPFIEGLAEQKAALKRIKDNLKEVDDINTFIKSVVEYSKKAKNTSYNIEVAFIMDEQGSLQKFKSPLVISDPSYILEAAQQYKTSIVNSIKADADKHHISLEAQDKAKLDWEYVPEK